MSCTKAEVHNVLQCRHKKIKPRQQATYTENCMSFEHVVLRYVSGQTDRLIAILRTTSWGAVTLHAMTNKWTRLLVSDRQYHDRGQQRCQTKVNVSAIEGGHFPLCHDGMLEPQRVQQLINVMFCISQKCNKRWTNDQATATSNIHRKLHVVWTRGFEICERTNRQTDRDTSHHIVGRSNTACNDKQMNNVC